MNRRLALQRLGLFSLLRPSLVAQSPESVDFLEHHPAVDMHCHPGNFMRRGAAEYAGDQITGLRAKGLSEGDVAKIGGGNALRVLQKVTKA